MSSWLVNKAHIDAIVTVAQKGPAGVHVRNWYAHEILGYSPMTDPDEVGRILWKENLYGVSCRYPGETAATLPGPCGLTDEIIEGYRFVRRMKNLTIPEALKAIACLRYQSCDSDTYFQSATEAWLTRLEHAIAACMVGYADAPWGIDV